MRVVRSLLFPVATGAALAGCGSSSGGAAAASPAAPASAAAPASPAAPAASAAGTTLKIANFAYDPTPLTVAPGSTIATTNADSAEHTVSSDKAGLFLGDDIAGGKTVTFTAPTTPGTYTFHCQYHASMHGTLIVK